MFARASALVWSCAFFAAAPAAAKIVQTKSANSSSQENDVVIGSGIEASDGEVSVPFLIEWAPASALKLSIEPSFGAVRKDTGDWVSGVGDVDASVIYEVIRERRWTPSVALEGDMKLPSASVADLGTGTWDDTLALVLGKDVIWFDVELNASYTFSGTARDLAELSMAAEWHVNPAFDVEVELVGSTGAVGRTGVGFGGGFRRSVDLGGSEAEATIGIAEHADHFKVEQGMTVKTDGSYQAVLAWEYDFGDTR